MAVFRPPDWVFGLLLFDNSQLQRGRESCLGNQQYLDIVVFSEFLYLDGNPSQGDSQLTRNRALGINEHAGPK